MMATVEKEWFTKVWLLNQQLPLLNTTPLTTLPDNNRNYFKDSFSNLTVYRNGLIGTKYDKNLILITSTKASEDTLLPNSTSFRSMKEPDLLQRHM